MLDIKEFYILGLPIETPIGECQFLKVKEYPDYFGDLQIISLTKDQLIYKYNELNKDGSLNEFIDELKKLSLYKIVIGIPELKQSYYNILTKVFNGEEPVSLITEDNFDYYRSLVMRMNCLKEEEINPNPEIQRAIERSKRVKSQEGNKLEFADIVSSVVGYNGLSYKDINEFTIYQLYMTFHRIAQIKGYDTAVLFLTVQEKFKDNIKVDNWSKHINLFEEEKHVLSHDEFKKTIGSAVSE